MFKNPRPATKLPEVIETALLEASAHLNQIICTAEDLYEDLQRHRMSLQDIEGLREEMGRYLS